MEIYKPFEVVVVPFPFTDKRQTKRRPAIVLSSAKHQRETKHCTLLMVTTAAKSHWPSDTTIAHLDTTGLTHDSIIRQKVFTIDSRLILRKAGHLHKVDKEALLKQLAQHLPAH
jgi:mRNA interferase MazF